MVKQGWRSTSAHGRPRARLLQRDGHPVRLRADATRIPDLYMGRQRGRRAAGRRGPSVGGRGSRLRTKERTGNGCPLERIQASHAEFADAGQADALEMMAELVPRGANEAESRSCGAAIAEHGLEAVGDRATRSTRGPQKAATRWASPSADREVARLHGGRAPVLVVASGVTRVERAAARRGGGRADP